MLKMFYFLTGQFKLILLKFNSLMPINFLCFSGNLVKAHKDAGKTCNMKIQMQQAGTHRNTSQMCNSLKNKFVFKIA